MNKNLYRIVFNQSRGLLMAVAECVPAWNGGGGRTQTGKNAHRWATLRPVYFALLSAFSAVTWQESATAQIIADPTAPKSQQANIGAAANGVPLVNIQAPSAAGVSRNTYSQFDVNGQGAILNNARINSQTQLGGWVQANPWLAGGAARVILNEVNSSNPSQLRGYVEVAGDRAQVVIANPSGVTCDGCGFINANRATLTTGTPIMNGGVLEGYRVQGGAVTIQGAGLDGRSADYTDIIARSVQVNAGIWAQNLNVIAGANTVSADLSQVTPIAGSGTSPAFAIDVAQLGGMYAGKIALVGTEAGVGVRNAGQIGASVGEVVVTLDGRLENSGRLSGMTNLRVDASRGIENTGTFYSQGDAQLSSQAGGLKNRGTLAATGSLAVSAMEVDNDSATLGAIGGNLDITATSGRFSNNAGWVEAGQRIQLASLGVSDLGGVLTGQDIAVRSAGYGFDNSGGSISARGSIDLLSGALLNNGGLIQAVGALGIDTQNQKLTNTNSGSSGGILSQGGITLKTGDLDNTAGFVGAQGVLAITSQAVTNGGMLVGESSASLQATLLNNRGGKIQAQGDVAIDVGSGDVDNTGTNGSSLMRSGGNLTIQAGRLINANTQGTDQGIEGLSVAITANDLNNTQGAVRATESLAVTSSGTVDNTLGLLSSGKRSVIADGAATPTARTLSISNDQGTLIAGESLTVKSAVLTGAGKLFSQGDLTASLAGDYTNSNDIQASGNLSLDTGGKLTNIAKLLGGTSVDVHGAEIENAAQGEISASATKVRSDGLLTNRGLIDGGTSLVKAVRFDNLGTGRVYGDHVAIEAATLNNLAEGSSAPVIAARDRLDIGVQNLSNQEHALIFSAGDMAIGSSLDAANMAVGSATTVDNASATIEAQGRLDLVSGTITNRNLHFSTQNVVISSVFIQEYQGYGSANRYLPSQISLPIVRDSFYRLSAPDGQFDKFYRYDYTRTITETQVLSSDPGKILAGQTLKIDANSVLNDKSQIIAGGTLQVAAADLINTQVSGQRIVTDAGTAYFYIDHQPSGCCNDWTEVVSSGYYPAPTVTALNLSPTVYTQNTQPGANGSGAQISALAINRVSQGASSTGSSVVSMNNPAALSSSLNSSSLFHTNPNAQGSYLIETDPRFTNYQTWLSSDYMLQQLAVDPSKVQKRLGDGYYEQQLIRDQVAQLTGRRFLDSYASDEAEYRGLIDQGVTFAKAHQLIPGVALTEAQIAQLTSDIVWLVEKDVTLPDGTQTRALVPQVYVRIQPGDIDGNGALLAGSNVDLAIGGKVTNSGTIAGRNVLSLTADTINNLGGRIAGNNVALTAKTDLNNLSGLFQGGDSLTLSAGRDINVASTTRSSQGGQGERTNVDRVAGLYVSNPNAVLLASAGRDVNLLGAQIVNEGAGGTTAIVATNNLNLGTVGESYRQDLIFNSRNTRKESSRQEVGTSIQSSGDIQLLAGQDVTARAAQVTSDKGAVLASAGRDLKITAGEAGYNLDSTSYSKSTGSWWSKKTVTTSDSVKDTTAIASTFSGDTVQLQSGRDLTITGSKVAAVNAATLAAGRDLALETATETHTESHFREEKASGFSFSLKDGLSYGKSAQNQNLSAQGSTQVGSTLSGASVSTTSGRDTRIAASTVLADQNIDIAAGRNIDILAAANTQTTKSETRSSAASLGLLNGLSANFTILSSSSGADRGNGTAVTQSTSLLSANGGNLTLNAGLDSQYQGRGQGNITAQGADLLAKEKIALSANAIDLQAIANTTFTQSHSENKNFTIGARPAGVVGGLIGQIADRAIAAYEGTGNSRLDSAMALKAGYDTYKLFNPSDAASAAAQSGPDALKNAGSGSSFGVSVTIGSSKSESNSESASSQAFGTNIQAKDIALTARETDIHLQAAKLQAETITLDAARDVLLEAAANTSSLHTDNSSSSASIGATFGFGQQNGISFQLGMQNAKGKANGSETVYDNTLITATDTLKIRSGNDTTLKGAQLASNQVTLDVGRNLSIETLQDTSKYETEQKSGGFGVSLCIPPICYGTSSASINLSSQSVKHNYQSAVGQSGIAAGAGGFDIQVGQLTDLVGAAITSAADAYTNHLSTGSLVSRDLTNTQRTDAHSSSIALAGSFGAGAASAFTQGANNIAPNVLGNKALNEGMPKSRSEQSQTLSVISPAQIQITGSGDAERDARSQATADTLTQRDPKTANQTLTNTLTLQQAAQLEQDLKTARQNDEAARLLVQTGQQMAEDIGTAAGKKFDALNKEAAAARDAGQTEQADALMAEAEKWGDGGVYRVGLHTLVGALTGGGIDGALGAAASSKVTPILAEHITALDIPTELKIALIETTGAAVGGLVGGSAGAATGLNETANNLLSTLIRVSQLAGQVARYGLDKLSVAEAAVLQSCVSNTTCRQWVTSALPAGAMAWLISQNAPTQSSSLVDQIPGGYAAGDKPQPSGPLVNVPVGHDPKDGTLVNTPPQIDTSSPGYSPDNPTYANGPLVNPNNGPIGATITFAVPPRDKDAINSGLTGVMGGLPIVDGKKGSNEISHYPNGTQEDAVRVFNSLPLDNIKSIDSSYGEWGLWGTLPDGTKVIVRPSKDGRPTIEIQDTNRPGGERRVQEIRFGSK